MLQYGHWVIKKPEQESALLATAPPAAHISLSLSRQRSLGYAAAQPGLRRFALSRLAYAVAQPHVPLSHTAPQPSLHRRTHSHLSGVPPTFHLSAFSTFTAAQPSLRRRTHVHLSGARGSNPGQLRGSQLLYRLGHACSNESQSVSQCLTHTARLST